jgi:hypothetical protein
MSTIDDVITKRVRILLDDEAKADWDDEVLFLWYDDARRIIVSRRDDAKLDTSGAEITFVDVTALNNTAQLADQWIPALTDYICARGFEDDAGDKRDLDRSEHHMKNFFNLIEVLG